MTTNETVFLGVTSRAQKIAVSMPRAVFRELERKRKELGRTRSAVVTEALRHYLARATLSEEELRYVSGYLRHPEDEDDAVAIAKASSWGEWNEAE